MRAFSRSAMKSRGISVSSIGAMAALRSAITGY
jgi:hypothetical protein